MKGIAHIFEQCILSSLLLSNISLKVNVIYSMIFFEANSVCLRRVFYYESITERVKSDIKELHLYRDIIA